MHMDSVDDWPREAKLWIGALTVVSWIVLCGAWVAVKQMDRDIERSRKAVQDVTDSDYLFPFRSGIEEEAQ